MELEWDDIFGDEETSSSAVFNVTGCVDTDRCAVSPAPPPLPPQYIQEMRRTATKLVHGSYVEESEFQDDVMVYDLVAQKDTKAATFERIKVANRQSRESRGQQVSAMLTATGRSVLETVNSIMSSRRRSEDGGKEERRKSQDCKEGRRRSEGFGKDFGRMQEEGEEKTEHVVTNGFHGKNHIIGKRDDINEETEPFGQDYNQNEVTTFIGLKQIHPSTPHIPCSEINSLPNRHLEPESQGICAPATDAQLKALPDNKITNNNFVSQYCELMLSLGVEPDCDDIMDNVSTFRGRVRALRQKLQKEEELMADFGYGSSWDDTEEEGEEEEDEKNSSERARKRQEVPFTGEEGSKVKKIGQ